MESENKWFNGSALIVKFNMNEYGDIYRSFQRVLVAQNRPQAALEVAEQGKIRAYKEFLTTYLLLPPNQHPVVTPPSFTEIQEIVKNTENTVIYYSVLYDENQLDRFYRYQLNTKEPFYFSPVSLLIWVIQNTGELKFQEVDLKSFWQDKQMSLAGLVRRVWEDCQKQDHHFNQENLALLYHFLIEPIRDYLPNFPGAKLTIIPQDFLYFTPFAALLLPDQSYLIDHYQISILPSLQVLKQIDQEQLSNSVATKSSVLIVGNPTMPALFRQEQPTATLPSLPQKEQEVKAIADLCHSHGIIRSAATKAAILNSLKNTTIIHLATYGMLSYHEGFPCAIALAPGIQDHGWLTAAEIMKLQLNVELIVISASYSKSGNLWSNGIEGLIRSLILAGAKNVLLALYPNQNCPTDLFFQEFYRHFLDSHNATYSLQQAIIKIKSEYPHPQNWAGWIFS
jgi:CHAT domain-containing protein